MPTRILSTFSYALDIRSSSDQSHRILVVESILREKRRASHEARPSKAIGSSRFRFLTASRVPSSPHCLSHGVFPEQGLPVSGSGAKECDALAPPISSHVRTTLLPPTYNSALRFSITHFPSHDTDSRGDAGPCNPSHGQPATRGIKSSLITMATCRSLTSTAISFRPSFSLIFLTIPSSLPQLRPCHFDTHPRDPCIDHGLTVARFRP